MPKVQRWGPATRWVCFASSAKATKMSLPPQPPLPILTLWGFNHARIRCWESNNIKARTRCRNNQVEWKVNMPRTSRWIGQWPQSTACRSAYRVIPCSAVRQSNSRFMAGCTLRRTRITCARAYLLWRLDFTALRAQKAWMRTWSTRKTSPVSNSSSMKAAEARKAASWTTLTSPVSHSTSTRLSLAEQPKTRGPMPSSSTHQINLKWKNTSLSATSHRHRSPKWWAVMTRDFSHQEGLMRTTSKILLAEKTISSSQAIGNHCLRHTAKHKISALAKALKSQIHWLEK